MSQAIPVVINQSSGNGSGKSPQEQLRRSFEQAGLEARLVAAPPERLPEVMQQAAQEAPGLLVAGGGDGTISLAAGLAHEHGLALGVLPMGTLNHFAKDLGLPLDLEEAVRVIAGGKRRRVDLGQVNGRVFINNLSLGLYPRAVQEREEAGWLAWAGQFVSTGWALIKVMAHSPRQRVRLEAQGQVTPIRSHLIFVGNNRYLDSKGSPATRETLDEGGLDIFWVPSTGVWSLLKAAFFNAKGRYYPHHASQCFTDTATITSPKPSLRAVCDGELLRLKPPLELASLAGALEVLVP